jgi:hypothetical protein
MTLDEVHADLVALRADLGALRTDFRVDVARLEAKIDSKPGLIAMFGAIMVVVLGFASVSFGTIQAVNTLGYVHATAPPSGLDNVPPRH